MRNRDQVLACTKGLTKIAQSIQQFFNHVFFLEFLMGFRIAVLDLQVKYGLYLAFP